MKPTAAKWYYRIHDSHLFRCLLGVIVMSAFDAVATVAHIDRGVATEGNPLMEVLITSDLLAFFYVKMAVTVGGLVLCYCFCALRAARLGLKAMAVIYSFMSFYHLIILAAI